MSLAQLSPVFLSFFFSSSLFLSFFLSFFKLDPGLALVLADGQVVGEVSVAHEGGKGVPVLMNSPLKPGGVCVPCPHILGLEVLYLGEDVLFVLNWEVFILSLVEVNQANISLVILDQAVQSMTPFYPG